MKSLSKLIVSVVGVTLSLIVAFILGSPSWALAQSESPTDSIQKSNSEKKEKKKKKKRKRKKRARKSYIDEDDDEAGYETKFQAEFVKPITGYEVTSSILGTTTNIANNENAEIGARFSYSGIHDEGFGSLWSLAYLQYGSGSTSASLRLEGSGTYTFNNYTYSYLGLHIQKFLNSEVTATIDFGYGGHLGLGLQLTKKFGGKIGYTYTKFLEKEVVIPIIGTTKISTTLSSLEFAFYYSF